MIAFWKYDLFPYCLWGKITKEREDGYVFIESYGCWFKPVAIFTEVEGLALVDKLNFLDKERTKEIKAINLKFSKQLQEAAPFFSRRG